jgi:hypothetical protein
MKVLRVVWGRVEERRLPALADAFGAATQGRPLPGGLIAWHLGMRAVGDHHEVAAVTVWESVEDALAAFADDLASNRTLAQLDRVANFSGAAVYEIEGASVRAASHETVVLRVATGILPNGTETEILSEMRRRVTSIGSDAVEAYVGRRMVGQGVEAVFVSLWERAPDLARLEDPIWPDLAELKADFAIRTFVAARGGVNASTRSQLAAPGLSPDTDPPGDDAIHRIRLYPMARATRDR